MTQRNVKAIPSLEESIAYLCPDLIPFWSLENQFSPTEVKPGSRYPALWECNAGHKFEKRCDRITDNGSFRCLYCERKKPSAEYNLFITHPDIAALFDVEKNGIETTEVLPGGKIPYWWTCTTNASHTWQSSVTSLIKTNVKCGFCDNKKFSPENSLSVKRPELAREFDVAKNGTLPSEVIANQSRKVYWWKCEEFGHSWSTRLYTRINHGWGCPYCANRYVSEQNNLLAKFPLIALEFDETVNGCSASSIMATTDTHYAWKCKTGHQWRSAVSTRTVMGTDCPYCSNQKIDASNNLVALFPAIAKEYSLTNKLPASEIGAGSYRKVSWECNKKHTWVTSVVSRTASGTGCPKCVRTNVSAIEKEFRKEFQNSGVLTEVSSTPLDIPWGKSKLLRADFHGKCKGAKVVVEYDGSYFHKDKFQKDEQKTQALLDAGWIVVRIREQTPSLGLDFLGLKHDNFIQVKYDYSPRNLQEIKDKVLEVDVLLCDIT